MVSSTAGWPLLDAHPVFGVLLPIFMVAICSSSTGTPPTLFTTVLPNWSTSVVVSEPRIRYSFPYS